MKKTILLFIVSLILNYTLNINDCFAQWQADVRLTSDPAVSFPCYNNGWCIAVSGNVVHIVWYDYRDGANGEIYYKRSTDEGVSWGGRYTVDK